MEKWKTELQVDRTLDGIVVVTRPVLNAFLREGDDLPGDTHDELPKREARGTDEEGGPRITKRPRHD
ncbi:MAG: hypothetical protein ABEL04_05765 [Salinibacter sp.]|uniref:hypothetical protein n=1 Tax=Salinibacter sp. TaxID=2065818 RepID=UPI0035D4D623